VPTNVTGADPGERQLGVCPGLVAEGPFVGRPALIGIDSSLRVPLRVVHGVVEEDYAPAV
jgi:hypothetical protein